MPVWWCFPLTPCNTIHPQQSVMHSNRTERRSRIRAAERMWIRPRSSICLIMLRMFFQPQNTTSSDQNTACNTCHHTSFVLSYSKSSCVQTPVNYMRYEWGTSITIKLIILAFWSLTIFNCFQQRMVQTEKHDMIKSVLSSTKNLWQVLIISAWQAFGIFRHL